MDRVPRKERRATAWPGWIALRDTDGLQAGLRARGWHQAADARGGVFPCVLHSDLDAAPDPTYRCGGSAGLDSSLLCRTGFPFHPGRPSRADRDT
jgi:hypothetical protein